MKLELRYAKALMRDLELEEKQGRTLEEMEANKVGETIEVLDTIKDVEIAKLLFQSNGFDIDGKLNSITYRGYDIAKKCLFVVSAVKVQATDEEIKEFESNK